MNRHRSCGFLMCFPKVLTKFISSFPSSTRFITLPAGRHGSEVLSCWFTDTVPKLHSVPNRSATNPLAAAPQTAKFFSPGPRDHISGSKGPDLGAQGPGVHPPLSVEQNDFLCTESPLPAGGLGGSQVLGQVLGGDETY